MDAIGRDGGIARGERDSRDFRAAPLRRVKEGHHLFIAAQCVNGADARGRWTALKGADHVIARQHLLGPPSDDRHPEKPAVRGKHLKVGNVQIEEPMLVGREPLLKLLVRAANQQFGVGAVQCLPVDM